MKTTFWLFSLISEKVFFNQSIFDLSFYLCSTGRAAANVHLTPCTLELGGKSPAYIDEASENSKNMLTLI
jgi:hypothetical protein